MSGDTDALFAATTPAPAPATTPSQRRRARQAEAVAHGQHPLSVPLRTPIRLHPVAQREIAAQDGPSCGSCAYRQRLHGGNRNYPKCVADQHRRATHGEATDVRRSWPACESYVPEEK